MLIVEDGITGELERIKHELQRLGRMKITIGIQGAAGKNARGEEIKASADIMTIAGIHEFGATIKAKNVKNLAIPIAKKAVGKSPRDFDGLFFIRSKAGYLFGCISKKERSRNPRRSGRPTGKEPGRKKPGNGTETSKSNDDIEFLFILFEAVEIPERSFLRAGYDSNSNKIVEDMKDAVSKVLCGEWDAETAANHVGMRARDYIIGYMMDADNFDKKGSIVMSTSNWPDNPLVETGRLRNSITYAIMEG